MLPDSYVEQKGLPEFLQVMAMLEAPACPLLRGTPRGYLPPDKQIIKQTQMIKQTKQNTTTIKTQTAIRGYLSHEVWRLGVRTVLERLRLSTWSVVAVSWDKNTPAYCCILHTPTNPNVPLPDPRCTRLSLKEASKASLPLGSEKRDARLFTRSPTKYVSPEAYRGYRLLLANDGAKDDMGYGAGNVSGLASAPPQVRARGGARSGVR